MWLLKSRTIDAPLRHEKRLPPWSASSECQRKLPSVTFPTSGALPLKSTAQIPRNYYRSLFLSDLHLGHFASRPDRIIRFLQRNHAENYYLVGDILDLWIPKEPVWTCHQEAVISHFRHRQADGAKLIYIRGNHDPRPNHAPLVAKLPVEVVDCAVHEAADGRKYWVAHGDEHDNSSINHKSFTIAGHKIFATLAAIESRLRRAIHLRNHDAATKYFVSTFYQIIHPKIIYQRKLVQEAKLRGLDGVICGHFHQPDLRQFGCITYANCGDWMQNFSALAEDYSGRLHLLKRNAGYRTSTDPNSVDKRARV